MNKTPIEWCTHSLNAIRARDERGHTGHYCEKVSPGCKNCYASRLQKRFGMPEFMDQLQYCIVVDGKHAIGPKDAPIIDVFLDEKKLLEPLWMRKPARIFWEDMSDLCGEWVPDEWIDKHFVVFALTPQHTHLVLTKRSKRLRQYWRNPADVRDRWFQIFHDGRLFPGDSRRAVLGYPSRAAVAEGIAKGWRSLVLENVHLGASIEDQKACDARIEDLANTPAARRFISYEPALERVDFGLLGTVPHSSPYELYKDRIHQIIIGGESGPKARPFYLEWARDAIRQCREAGVAPFFKQAGSNAFYEKESGNGKGSSPVPLRIRHSKGGNLEEIPFEDLRVREYPQ